MKTVSSIIRVAIAATVVIAFVAVLFTKKDNEEI